MSRELSAERLAHFPKLQPGTYQVTSDETAKYNCIAHAANRDDGWWWPADETGVYWPEGVDKQETLQCFIEAFTTRGYLPCDHNEDLEDGFEKIAIYVESNREPTHAARQLPNGYWTSKLGEWEDIEHRTLEALEDDAGSRGLGYGKAVQIMKRPRQQTSQP